MRFRERSGIGVVLNFDWDAVLFFNFRGELKVAPAWQIGRIDHYPCIRIKWARCADSNSADRTSRGGIMGKQKLDSGYHGSHSLGGAAIRDHRGANLALDFTTTGYKSGGDFCSPNINANKPRVRDWLRRHFACTGRDPRKP
jgi:hypothetical protein